MHKNLFWIAGAVGVIGYVAFGSKLRMVLKDRVKDWSADLMTREYGLTKELTRPAVDMVLD